MEKKGQGLSLNTIIVAALALLVLIIIAMIFTGRIKLWRENTDACVNKGGRCVSDDRNAQGEYEYCSSMYDKIIAGDCPEDMICCLST
ncbi:hypothetical protein GF327_06910 [Candidatus Woesearchaeota archaeon]|nr:hypothetical protein [Candidatus Woesearchaeota archaeon]